MPKALLMVSRLLAPLALDDAASGRTLGVSEAVRSKEEVLEPRPHPAGGLGALPHCSPIASPSIPA